MNMSSRIRQAYNILVRDNFCLGCEYRFNHDGCYEQECYHMAVEPIQELIAIHNKQIQELDSRPENVKDGSF